MSVGSSLRRAISKWIPWEHRQMDGSGNDHGTQPHPRTPPNGWIDGPPADAVERLLSENSGRVRQGDIVDCTGWSPGKVSRILSQMEADERVHRIRDGREKIVCLPPAVPASFRRLDHAEKDRIEPPVP